MKNEKDDIAARLAVDFVLLPSEQMTEIAIEANKKLLLNNHAKIALNKQDCLPHISLAMGCIYEKDMTAIAEILDDIAKRSAVGRLKAVDVHVDTNSVGEEVSVLRIEKTSRLQSLHETITREFTPYLSYDVAAEMLIMPDEVRESTLLWVKNYRRRSSFAAFFPHITIGYGRLENIDLPLQFTASKLALCHLGNHCTCRKILVSTEIDK